MPKTWILATAALFIGAAALPAVAQTAADEPSAADDGPSHALTGAAVIFNMMDSDGDGALDIDEVGALTRAIFTTLDRNEDGKLSKDELNAALRRLHGGPSFGPPPGGPRAGEGRGPNHGEETRGPHHGDHHPGDQRFGQGQSRDSGQPGDPRFQGPPQRFQQALTRGPAAVAPAIAGRLLAFSFGSIDANDDGAISQEEYAAAFPRLAQSR